MAPRDSDPFRRSRLQLYSRLKLKNIFPGEWESIYLGEGIEFAASRPFEAGDDLRDLDLGTLVQTGEEEIIQRVVGRQMKVYVWADLSGSLQHSAEALFPSKREIRDNAVGLIVFSSWNAYSPVGLCAFDREICRFFPPAPGESYCVEIMDWLLNCESGKSVSADIPTALAFLLERASPQSLVFFISDFQDPVFEEEFSDLIKPAAQNFDMTMVIIRDPMERHAALPRRAILSISDDEGGRSTSLELTLPKLREIQSASARHLSHIERNFDAAGAGHLVLDSPSIEESYRGLSGYFESRKTVRS
jgi:uncharacterized protein (DUF58 family)